MHRLTIHSPFVVSKDLRARLYKEGFEPKGETNAGATARGIGRRMILDGTSSSSPPI